MGSAIEAIGESLQGKIFRRVDEEANVLSIYVGGPLQLVEGVFDVMSYGLPFVNFFEKYYSGVYPVPIENLKSYHEVSLEEAQQINPNLESLVKDWNKKDVGPKIDLLL